MKPDLHSLLRYYEHALEEARQSPPRSNGSEFVSTADANIPIELDLPKAENPTPEPLLQPLPASPPPQAPVFLSKDSDPGILSPSTEANAPLAPPTLSPPIFNASAPRKAPKRIPGFLKRPGTEKPYPAEGTQPNLRTDPNQSRWIPSRESWLSVLGILVGLSGLAIGSYWVWEALTVLEL